MARIRDNLTGEILEVPDDQLGQYGLSSPNAMTADNKITNQMVSQGQLPQSQAEIYPQANQGGFNEVGFRQAAIAAGYKGKEIDNYLKDKKTEVTDLSKSAASLRKEFSKETKDLGFEEARKSWQKAKSAQKTGAGDLTVIYSYIKALDPTSVVREGEINLSKAAESVPSNIIRAYQRAKEGKVMSPELRQEMVNELSLIYNERASRQKELNEFYSGLATDQGVDPQRVIGKLGKIEMAEVKDVPPKAIDNKESRLGNFLLDAGEAIARPVVTSGKNIAAGGQAIAANALSQISPELSNKLWKQNILGSQETFKRASERPRELLGEQLGASAELATPYVLGKVLSGVKGAKLLNPKAARAEEIAKVPNLDVKSVIKAGDKASKLNPAAAKDWKVMKTAFPKSGKMATNDLVQLLSDWGNQTYTVGGDVRAKAAASIMNRVYGASREAIKQQAPEVARYTGVMKHLINAPKVAQKASWLGLKAAGIGKLIGL